jgi:NADH dehydrogenase
VGPDLSLAGHPEVFVVGDLACAVQDGTPVPAVAPAAMQEGRHTAHNVLRAMRGEATLPFRYKNKGSLATIGRSAAVAELGKVRLSGPPAWLAWLFLHLLFLVGFRNRVIVVFQWAWSFVSFDRGARLITGPIVRDADKTAAERRTA